MRLRVLFYLVFAWMVCSCIPNENPSTLPNIVLINIDDMGWKDLGFMGSEFYETPNLDALAKQGMVFTNGYAAAANCAPSRACLMTGQWTPKHGIYTVASSERGNARHRKLIPTKNTTTLAQKHKVFPEVLQQHGYSTCHAGKWHLSENPLDFGFEKNIGGGHNGHPSSYYPPYKNVKIEAGKNGHLTDLVMEQTLAFVDSVSGPFFLYYSPYAVHTPIQPITTLLDKYENKAGSQGQNNAAYATMVENLDRNIGLLLSKLKEKGHFEHTLIVFTSDNGGLYGITQQKPLRAGKGSYYEGGIREPFFFVWKDKIQPNTISEVPITNLDLFPTLLGAAGIEYEEDLLDGGNLLPLLSGSKNQLERALYWHFPIYLQAYDEKNNENRDSLFRTRPGSVIRDADWKLHYYFEDKGMELYNLKDDIGEGHNLVLEHPEKAMELLGQLTLWWQETQAPIPSELNPEYQE
ncbi:sulfatase [Flagellimonas algicola]|uniref:Sulfatase n=1 Tax=Flagellimonas algicola TaxID=2583815 RepID=A0ABY2WN66_9FLAO|nr:sulfatase [Allomuricauda algicola]TMU56429.1 sulfatase [Allomuricauda algicola]